MARREKLAGRMRRSPQDDWRIEDVKEPDGDYGIVVEPLRAEAGGGFMTYVPDLSGCIFDGATPCGALENGYAAARAWLETAERLGRPAPAPTRERRTA